jgi:hypothetical protein
VLLGVENHFDQQFLQLKEQFKKRYLMLEYFNNPILNLDYCNASLKRNR